MSTLVYQFTDLQSIPKGAKRSFEECTHVTQRLPATIEQLVEASPSATEDGALLLGSHSSSIFVVDGKSGTLLRVLSPDGQQALHQHHAGMLHTAE